METERRQAENDKRAGRRKIGIINEMKLLRGGQQWGRAADVPGKAEEKLADRKSRRKEPKCREQKEGGREEELVDTELEGG